MFYEIVLRPAGFSPDWSAVTLRLEPTILLDLAGRLAKDYLGGYWQFYALSNGGFYMASDAHAFEVICENGYVGRLSGQARASRPAYTRSAI